MKLKGSSTIGLILKFVVVFVLIWNLPMKSNQTTQVIEASTEETLPSQNTSQDKIQQVASKNKTIHIYSTHQSEKYNGSNVVEASHMLMEKLNALGYICDVEETDFELYKSANGIAYNYSYVASKKFLEESINRNGGGYDLIIDFHRDSIPRSSSTITVNNTSYAKIMFVVGKSSGKYESVMATSTRLHELAMQKVNGISRGIMEKQSHYNQGVSDHMVLIEVGGAENTKEEIINTVDVLSSAIDGYLGG